MSTEPGITVDYFSDLLCVWAYIGQIRVDELRRSFPTRVTLRTRFVSVFGSTRLKIGEGWQDRGGYDGYARHVQEIAARFDHVEVHPQLWTGGVPAGSASAHQFARAVALAAPAADATTGDGSRSLLDELCWRLRVAFFREMRDIAALEVQLDVARDLDLPLDAIRRHLDDGSAQAKLAEDYAAAQRHRIEGSPTWLLDGGRQTLYGNVGYRVVEANVEELLRDNSDRASWC